MLGLAFLNNKYSTKIVTPFEQAICKRLMPPGIIGVLILKSGFKFNNY